MRPNTAKPMAARFRAFLFVSLVLPILGLSASATVAQDTDPQPLRPADTSSPRATLRTFLTNADAIIEDWRRGELSAPTYRALLRALETLDLSATPNGDTWGVQTRRLLLLKEVLGRLEIPPDDRIPGGPEVADGAVTRWTIPDTRITIARVEAGPRAGEFLFSADTVERLVSLYRQVKHLPYKPGATAGIYEKYKSSDRTVHARESEFRYRLMPADTSSPRSTLEGLLDSVNRAYALVMEADAALKATPPTMTREEALAIERRANNLLRRATATLDLSEVPEALRQDVSVETVLQLKEIVDRMYPPPVDTIPEAQMVAAARQGVAGSFSQTSGPLRWRMPNTDIEIVETLEGEQQGRFLFSAGTVRRLRDSYEKVRNLPYRPTGFDVIEDQYLSPGLSPGFYEYYITTPGYLVPRARALGAWLDGLPDWLEAIHGGQTVWQWIALVFCVLAVVVTTYVVVRVSKRLAARRRPPLDAWLMVLVPIVIAIVVIAVQDFLDEDLNLTGDILSVVVAVGGTIVLVMMAWAVWSLFEAVAETTIASPWIIEGVVDASLLRIIARLLGVVAGVWIVLGGLQGLGADIVPLLAGLGVGGLAVALAVRPTLENLIGGLMLYFDRPVRVGDYCSFGGQTGTIESIGLRSTQIRGIDRTLISIPNAKFADMEIINWAQCDRMLISATIGLRYETEDDHLRHVLVKIREMLHAHPKIDPETVRVRFAGYGASSLDVAIRIYALTRDWNEFFAIREDVFLRIKAIISASGTALAIPSQTLYMGRDEGLDEERAAAAVQEVETWRRRWQLPFPRMRKERTDELEGTLDYPPRGSTDTIMPDAESTEAAEPLSAEPLSTEPLSTEPLSAEPEDADEGEAKRPPEPERR